MKEHNRIVAEAGSVLDYLSARYEGQDVDKALQTLLVALELLTTTQGLGEYSCTLPSGKNKVNELEFVSTRYTMN